MAVVVAVVAAVVVTVVVAMDRLRGLDRPTATANSQQS